MSKELIVSSTGLETKVAILDNNVVTELFIERTKNKGILGNIYKGRVTKVLPGMQAAFVDIGLERHAFLYIGDFLATAYVVRLAFFTMVNQKTDCRDMIRYVKPITPL